MNHIRIIDTGTGIIIGVLLTLAYAFWNGASHEEANAAPKPAKCYGNYVEMRDHWGNPVCLHGYPLK